MNGPPVHAPTGEESPEEVRDWLVRCLERDIIGPSWIEGTTDADHEEELDVGASGDPSRFYLTGMLAPQKVVAVDEKDIPPEHLAGSSSGSDEGGTGSENDDPHRDSVAESESWNETGAMGLTVRPENPNSPIVIHVKWGQYSKVKENDVRIWKRTPHNHSFECVPSNVPEDAGLDVVFPSEVDGVRLLVERSGPAEGPLITVRLANMRQTPSPRYASKAEAVMYQTQLILEGEFQDARTNEIQDDLSMDLLYRHSQVFARGHMVAVDWNEGGTKVWTSFLARHLVPEMAFNDELGQLLPDIADLANMDGVHGGLDSLLEFIGRFEAWGNDSRGRAREEGLGQALLDQFERNFEILCTNVRRMRGGIEFLKDNDVALRAFVFANQSIMESQRSASLADEHRIEAFTWKPFQIAFILLNLRGVADDESEDRAIVDLAWFPTGGGKTEAYLGLIAFASFLRRLEERAADGARRAPGITAIMRYTLRLLTADQAARLVRLIGGMNAVADSQHLGVEAGFVPFRVGMWIGKDASPNRLYEHPRQTTAESLILRAREGHPSRASTIAPFATCPWCGDASVGDVATYDILTEGWSSPRPRVMTRCRNAECAFAAEVPFTAVDDDLYLNPPTVLLATADKFVQAAYNPTARCVTDEFNPLEYSVRRMLGMEVGECIDAPKPPDLIVQDELHLLSGPLGTMAGLLETALAVSWQHTSGHVPKYIAATATIRGAERDVGLMYGRNLNVFPPPLLDASDNFFSSESPTRGRLHIGVLAGGGRARSALEQVAASMLASSTVARNSGVREESVDPYWTLVMYYNSLRELGSGMTAVQQNVPRWMSQYGGEYGLREFNAQPIELTSRRSSAELSEYRGRLNHTLGSGLPTVDVLHTSNMFQVGIDIKRLGVMTIVGQPRSNSEYIQSSGRVGRGKGPGLVMSLLRDRFPRDLSHFELFKSFHQEFFRHVDRTSITPFALRAVDRGAPTILMLLLRMTSPILAPNRGLMMLREHTHRERGRRVVDEFTTAIRERMRYDEGDLDPNILEQGIDKINAEWQVMAVAAREHHTNHGKELHWIIWNRIGAAPTSSSFFSSPFRTPDPTGIEDLRSGLSSLRDISEEVLMYEQGPEFRKMSSLPETHLFGHAAPGSVWEKDGMSWMTLGVPLWEMADNGFNGAQDGGLAINEPMLEQLYGRAVQLLKPPRASPEKMFSGREDRHVAVQQVRFPRTWICSGNPAHVENRAGRQEREDGAGALVVYCARQGCNHKAHTGRFISACSNGHVTEFDYHRWVHGAGSNCKYQDARLEIQYGANAAFTLDDWVVKCTADGCNANRSMKDVPWVRADEDRAWRCSGDRPWIKLYGAEARETCEERLVHLQVGNTAVTYPKRAQVLLIPPKVGWDVGDNPMYSFIRAQTERESDWPRVEQFLERDLEKTGFDTIDELILQIEEYWGADEVGLSFETLRSHERMGIIHGHGGRHSPDRFVARDVAGGVAGRPEEWADQRFPVRQLVRLDRLTVLNVLEGFSRVNGAGETQAIDDAEHRNLGGHNPFSMAMYNNGEGVFFDLKPEWLSGIAAHRMHGLGRDHGGMVFAKERMHEGMTRTIPALNDASPLYMSAFTVLHTLSHMLIKEFSAMSGFSLGSLAERLYLEVNEEGNAVAAAAILLYTSSPSADGTLGGLVQQAASVERVTNLINLSLEKLLACSNDPVCMDHAPRSGSENGAACHACVLLPETACEFSNLGLDRRWD